VCGDCQKLGKEELEYRQALRNVDRALRSRYAVSRRDRPVLERALRHPNPRVQLYVAHLIYAAERARAQWPVYGEQEDWPDEGAWVDEEGTLPESELAGSFLDVEATSDFEALHDEL
jgi:hypothetical protein